MLKNMVRLLWYIAKKNLIETGNICFWHSIKISYLPRFPLHRMYQKLIFSPSFQWILIPCLTFWKNRRFFAIIITQHIMCFHLPILLFPTFKESVRPFSFFFIQSYSLLNLACSTVWQTSRHVFLFVACIKKK